MHQPQAVPRIQAVIDECLPLLKALARGRYAVTIGGSHGKRTFDDRSDVDFRVFCDEIVGAPKLSDTEAWKAFCQVVDRWRAQGVDIDYCWVRKVSDIETQLDAWLSGKATPPPTVWSLFGYHLLTDIANQMVIEDPDGLIAAWQARLAPYPDALRRALLRRHMGSLNYWRTDYHYRNKVERGDRVFLAGIAARLVHDMVQVLFAINRAYYVGDGNNLHYVETFAIQPAAFAERVEAILYPPQTAHTLADQYDAIVRLIDDLAPLAAAAEAEEDGAPMA